jgi:hypothetical protein
VLTRPGFVGAAPALPGTTRIRQPPATPTCCDRPEAKVSHLHSNHSASRRTWKKIQSTNPLERINREIKRRTDVVQVFPNDKALLRLVTAVLFELHDEWIAFPRRYLPEGSMDQLYPAKLPKSAPALPNTTNTPTE